MVKYYVKKKDIFDIYKVTIVGSPTITSDGVASGFKNGTNYLRTSIKTTDLLNHSWEIVSNIIASTCTSAFVLWKFSNPTSQAGVEGWSSCTFNPNNNNMIFWYKTGDSNESSAQLYKSINIANYLNERIYISYAYNHNTGIYTFKAYLENGTVIGTLNYTATTTNKQLYYINTESNFIISIGTTSNGTLDVGGNIDLSHFSIIVDGELVYSPTKPVYFLERRKEGFDSSKFTVVGSPTITSDGVASGFVKGSYVRVFSDFYLKDSWEVKVAFSFSNTGTGCLLANPASHTNMLFVDAQRISFKFSSTGTSNTALLYSSKKLEPNKKYFARLKYNSTTGYTVDISTNGIDWENHITLANTDKMITNSSNPNAWDLGVLANEYTIFTDGSIDLSQISITVDGTEVFTGSKEKYCKMRGDE